MNTIRSFAADDATIIFGAVYDEAMGDELRVTVVATGLGAPVTVRQPKPVLVPTLRTGTDNLPVVPMDATAIDSLAGVIKSNREQRRSAAEALSNSGVDKYDIPAFLRRQAD